MERLLLKATSVKMIGFALYLCATVAIELSVIAHAAEIGIGAEGVIDTVKFCLGSLTAGASALFGATAWQRGQTQTKGV